MRTQPVRRKRRTDKEIFLDALTALSDQGERLVSNQALRERLGWEEPKYLRIKEQLVREQLINIGRGRGGSVGLKNRPDATALNVFVSYSHIDEEAKDQLLKHLQPLRRSRLIETWTDRQIKGGENWDDKIGQALEEADIILLIISIDFINSDYCYGIEMERSMEKHADGTARVIPLIYRNCMWSQAPFAGIQALPKDAKPITSWESIDDAFVNVVEGIKMVAEELLATG